MVTWEWAGKNRVVEKKKTKNPSRSFVDVKLFEK